MLSQIIKDTRFILTQGGFQTDITISYLGQTDIVQGLGIVHHLAMDGEGTPVSSKTAKITIPVDSFINVVPRNAKGDVYMIEARVKFADVSGVVKSYKVIDNYADDTLGAIVLLLSRFYAVD